MVFSGNASFIISNSVCNAAVWRELEVLLLDVVLADERLVPDENDEPSDIIESGLWITFAFSGNDPENEFLNFGAIKCTKRKRKYFSFLFLIFSYCY